MFLYLSFFANISHVSTDEINFDSSSPVIGPEPSINPSLLRNIQLPTPQLGTITDLERTIKTYARNPAIKEKVCEYIQKEVRVKSTLVIACSSEGHSPLKPAVIPETPIFIIVCFKTTVSLTL